VAAGVTFLASGSVLVLEVVGLRLIAPYVGVTLQTSTAVIGFALAAIAVGAWTGGAVADRTDPRRLLAPLLVAGGALVVAVLPLVRFAGAVLTGPAAGNVLLLAAVAVVVPAALLSAVPPMVVALQLQSLAETGSVVGRLSGIGTLGGIVATFATGFLLVAVLPGSVILVGTGALVTAAGLALAVLIRHRTPGVTAGLPVGLLALAVATPVLAALAPTPCERETAYHCARVEADGDSGRVLVLDTLRHSYVDLADPTHLQFEYVRAIASVTDVLAPAGQPLSALHLGGGGLTLPRYLAAVRPGTTSRVLEVDPGVVDLDADQLALQTSALLRVRVGDARMGLQDEPAGDRDLVVGDAFGGLSVPWQLTTVEALRLVDEALIDAGVYAVNLIGPPSAGLRPGGARHPPRGVPARAAAGPRASARRCRRRERGRRRLAGAAPGGGDRRCDGAARPGLAGGRRRRADLIRRRGRDPHRRLRAGRPVAEPLRLTGEPPWSRSGGPVSCG
jgi:MFS family permease